MKKYHLIRLEGHWVLKQEGAKRALILFKNRSYGDEFEMVLSATMTYAKDMKMLCIHNDDATVRAKLNRNFIELWEEK